MSGLLFTLNSGTTTQLSCSDPNIFMLFNFFILKKCVEAVQETSGETTRCLVWFRLRAAVRWMDEFRDSEPQDLVLVLVDIRAVLHWFCKETWIKGWSKNHPAASYCHHHASQFVLMCFLQRSQLFIMQSCHELWPLTCKLRPDGTLRLFGG